MHSLGTALCACGPALPPGGSWKAGGGQEMVQPGATTVPGSQVPPTLGDLFLRALRTPSGCTLVSSVSL